MLSLLLMFLAILLFIPDITLYKIIKIGPIEESAGILFFPFIYSIADSITEVYGRKNAFFILIACYLLSAFFSTIVMLVIHLPSPVGWEHQSAYNFVFSRGPWVIFVGMVSVGFSMYVNIKLIAKWKIKLRGKHFIIRSIASSSIGEIIVTGIAYPLLFYHIGGSLLYLMFNAYLFKVIYSIIGAFPARLIVFLLRYIDGIEQETYNEEFHILGGRKAV